MEAEVKWEAGARPKGEAVVVGAVGEVVGELVVVLKRKAVTTLSEENKAVVVEEVVVVDSIVGTGKTKTVVVGKVDVVVVVVVGTVDVVEAKEP